MDRESVYIIVRFLEALCVANALTCLFAPLIYFHSHTPLTSVQQILVVASIVYIFAMAALNVFFFIGFLKKWNRARILALVLSPAPFLGALLYYVNEYRWPLGIVSLMLQYTGLSFLPLSLFIPIMGLFFGVIGLLNQFTSPSAILLFGTCNLALFFFLRSNSAKNYFKEETSRTPTSEP